MDIDQLIQKIPKPALVVGVLILSLLFFVYNDPLRDECEVQNSIFVKKTQGLLTAVKTKSKKIQFPKIEYWKNRCREGNSIGSCNDYFEGWRVVTKELREVNDNCQVKHGAKNEIFTKQITHALQVMALVAWGDKPPAGMAERLGWMNESQIRTFCYLKKTFILIGDEESFLALRDKVYREYPGEWSEKFNINKLAEAKLAEAKLAETSADKNKKEDGRIEDSVDVAKLMAENRPRAYKTDSNPAGTLTKEEVFGRSIFSIRCDLYM